LVTIGYFVPLLTNRSVQAIEHLDSRRVAADSRFRCWNGGADGLPIWIASAE